jgi:hypothetical protein
VTVVTSPEWQRVTGLAQDTSPCIVYRQLEHFI